MRFLYVMGGFLEQQCFRVSGERAQRKAEMQCSPVARRV